MLQILAMTGSFSDLILAIMVTHLKIGTGKQWKLKQLVYTINSIEK